MRAIGTVVKINQTDHAQGHICPNVEKWLSEGPSRLLEAARKKRITATAETRDYYEATIIVLTACRQFFLRYGQLATDMAESSPSASERRNLHEIQATCTHLAKFPPRTFRESLQSLWFLFVLLQLESNASSFSPGRFDQYLHPYLRNDLKENRITLAQALELVEAFWIKCNQIVYLRSANSARYFAGFPIGFNIVLGGRTRTGEDAVNILSYLCLKAQEHIGLPQPNLSARIHENSLDEFIDECSRVIGLGSGMPQLFNDESIVPALEN